MTVFRILLHHLEADMNQTGRAIGAILADIGGHLRLMLGNPLGQRPLGEWRVPGQQVVERAAKSIDVHASIDIMAAQCLFGAR